MVNVYIAVSISIVSGFDEEYKIKTSLLWSDLPDQDGYSLYLSQHDDTNM